MANAVLEHVMFQEAALAVNPPSEAELAELETVFQLDPEQAELAPLVGSYGIVKGVLSPEEALEVNRIAADFGSARLPEKMAFHAIAMAVFDGQLPG